MNKKLLFGMMSLAALAACTNDDFETQNVVAEQTSPIQFEVINNNATMRASMNENTVAWSANDGDLFTLYHGAALGAVTGYQNATYKATEDASTGTAVLTTPSMILTGSAIMVWPADTTFRIGSADNLSLTIPADQSAKIQNEIPYVSDLINIGAYAAYNETTGTDYNTAGKDRKYPVYMRPMASQLNLIADYAGTDATLAELTDIDPISVTSVELLTTPGVGGTTPFTTEIPVTFTAALAADNTRWNAANDKNAWTHVTGVDRDNAVTTSDYLSTTCLTGNESAKFLILPQPALATGVADAGIVVNTIYGKVVIADPTGPHGSQYTAAEYNNAWYRYLSTRITTPTTEENVSATTAETSGVNAGKYKTVAVNPAMGMQQTINYMGNYVAGTSLSVVNTEPIGVALTRYVNVLLTHLDMSDLHIKTDKQLIDAAKVWKKMNLTGVTVYLDGDATTGEFEISQATIAKINEINTGKAVADQFHVKPCHVAAPTSEVCTRIVIKDGGNVPNLDFIVAGDTPNYADVVLKAGQNWSWTTNDVTIATVAKKAIKVGAGVQSIINEGTFASGATATIATCDATAAAWTNTPFVNAKGAEWNVTAGDLTVQFNVTNYGTVNISNGAEYHQDLANGAVSTFVNEATDLPSRFDGDDTEIGLVVNEGVFAVTGTTTTKGVINNYGLIKHDHANAKTYITANEAGGDFHTAFTDPTNKMGMISLPWDNKDEDNISVTAALNQGFIAVTVNGEVTGALDATQLGTKVNYLIVKAGPTSIADVASQVDYLEIDMTDDSELAWSTNQTVEGLVVLSPVNIKLGSTITVNGTGATYLGAKMYVGGTFTNTGGWSGYYGNTTAKVPTYYITY